MVPPKKKKPTTMSGHSSLPPIPELGSTTAQKLESDRRRTRSNSPAKPNSHKPTSNQSSPIHPRHSYISERPTALSDIEEPAEAPKPSPSPSRSSVVAHDSSHLSTLPDSMPPLLAIQQLKQEKLAAGFIDPPLPLQQTASPNPQRELDPEPENSARTETDTSQIGLEADFSNNPVQTHGQASSSLRALISWSRHSLAVDEDKLGQMLDPESEEVQRAHREMDGYLSQYEQAKRDYEFRKAQHQACVARQAEIRNLRREVDQAERELEELCHR